MKTIRILLTLLAATCGVTANTPPSVIIQSIAMRPGTTLMDIVYRVNDPDDSTVKVRALAFSNGVRSFANVLRPVTFAEGTEAKLGDAITANVNHTLTWDVAADWSVDLGQVKFEILARDGRGLLQFDWITIPAAGGEPGLTISKNASSDAEVLDALFWQYAADDPGLALSDGLLTGSASSGIFAGVPLVVEATPRLYSRVYLFREMNLCAADSSQVAHAAEIARAGLQDPEQWHVVNRPWQDIPLIVSTSNQDTGTSNFIGVIDATAVVGGTNHVMILRSDGTVEVLTDYESGTTNDRGQADVPADLTGVTAIAAYGNHSLALKTDGTVVGWGRNDFGQSDPPASLTGVTAIAAGGLHSLALKSDGTVVAWGRPSSALDVPAGLSGVIRIAAGSGHNLALRSDGTVIAWGDNTYGQNNVPAGLTGVTDVTTSGTFVLAVESGGTVVGWGHNDVGQIDLPGGLTDAVAVVARNQTGAALKGDDTVVLWGEPDRRVFPVGLTGVTAISSVHGDILALKIPSP